MRTPCCSYVSGCSKAGSEEDTACASRRYSWRCSGCAARRWSVAWELHDGERPLVEVWLRLKARRRGRCGRCGELASFYDQGGGERRWRHIDVGFATCELIADARRVDCPVCGPTVAQVPWARHDSAFTRAFEDLVVHDAIVGNKQAAADRYGVSWRAVNNMCVRVATEALGPCRSARRARRHRHRRGQVQEGAALLDRRVRPRHRQGGVGRQGPHARPPSASSSTPSATTAPPACSS